MSVLSPCLLLCSALALSTAAQAAIESAEIVMLVGSGERREAEAGNWQPAALKQQVKGGSFVRTLANSQLGLLLSDRTQIRLNQNSQLQIKTGAESTQWTESAVRLNSGRAWSQARPQTAQAGAAPVKPGRLVMETPSATLSIRGTDWEVEVGPDGQTQLVVLTGVVVMGNEQGTLEVAPGEAAVAETGKAPVKLQLLRPASRVQWVSSWQPQPRRWLGADGAAYTAAVRLIEAGDYTAALADLRPAAARDPLAALLAADLLQQQGESEAALSMLASHAPSGRTGAAATALRARALIRLDRLAQAQALLDAAPVDSVAQIEVLLARGELAIVQGEVAPARRAYQAALALDANNAEAWYGLGLIETERENIREARELLRQALRHNARMSRANAELAAAETFAGNLPQSEALLEQVLREEPANYVALTARGINRLKSAQPREALDDFLRAGLIEPRYARAWLFSGVAFYQLGERERALQAFQRAASLDERDPVPHLLGSVVQADALDYGAAIDAAREAQTRMPYLKSLNQVANNQRGSANLGSSLANFGLEEWARHYADAAQTPFWAGSHLFLADRHSGKFNKNSELMQGFLSDPTVFGASNRNSDLVASPGHHGRIDLMLDREDWVQHTLIASVNGLTASPAPLAYFLSGDIARANERAVDNSAHGRILTLGLGARPRHDLGLFAFATDTRILADLRMPTLTNDTLSQNETRHDLGLNFKWKPDNQFWFKFGHGQQSNEVQGAYDSDLIADLLNTAFATTVITPQGRLDRFSSSLAQDDWQLRHSLVFGGTQWSWGLEQSKQEGEDLFALTFAPVRMRMTERLSIRARDAYLSGRHEAGALAAQFDLFAQRVQVRRTDFTDFELLGFTDPIVAEDLSQEETYKELNPRLGVRWQPSARQSLRLVAQKWRRSASSGQLAAVDTLGIAVNDRLPSAGGLYRRLRLQYDAEAGTRAFFQGFLDRELVDNGLAGQRTSIDGFEVTQLETLRNRPEVFAVPPDLEDTPVFAEGEVSTLGLAVNFLVGKRQALSARYLRRQARQTGINAGLAIPYLSRDFLQLGSQWSLPERWLLGARATYRGARFTDDANLEPLAAGWSFGLSLYWETADKRSSVQAILDNLLSNKKVGLTPDAHLVLRYTHRF